MNQFKGVIRVAHDYPDISIDCMGPRLSVAVVGLDFSEQTCFRYWPAGDPVGCDVAVPAAPLFRAVSNCAK